MNWNWRRARWFRRSLASTALGPSRPKAAPSPQPRPSEPSQPSSPPTPADTFFWGQRLLALQPSSELPDSAACSRPRAAVGRRRFSPSRGRGGARPPGRGGSVRGAREPCAGAWESPGPPTRRGPGGPEGAECATPRPTHAGWLAPGRAGRVALTEGHLKRDEEPGSLWAAPLPAPRCQGFCLTSLRLSPCLSLGSFLTTLETSPSLGQKGKTFCSTRKEGREEAGEDRKGEKRFLKNDQEWISEWNRPKKPCFQMIKSYEEVKSQSALQNPRNSLASGATASENQSWNQGFFEIFRAVSATSRWVPPSVSFPHTAV